MTELQTEAPRFSPACHRHISSRLEAATEIETQEEKQSQGALSVLLLATHPRSTKSWPLLLSPKHSPAFLTLLCSSLCLKCSSTAISLGNSFKHHLLHQGFGSKGIPPLPLSAPWGLPGPQTLLFPASIRGLNNAHADTSVPTSTGLCKNKDHTCVTAASPVPHPEPGMDSGPQFSDLEHGGDDSTCLTTLW